MKSNRRTFIKQSSTIFGGSLILPTIAKSLNLNAARNIGLQLYTVRDQMKNDPVDTLKKIAQIGYKELETAGYSDGLLYGMQPSAFNKIVEDQGMKIISGHFSLESITNDWDRILKMTNEIGQKYIVLPWLQNKDRNLDVFRSIIDLLNKCGEEASKSGSVVAYHNHDFEFKSIDGEIPMDILLNGFDKRFVQFELDLFWAVKAGISPVEYFNKYPSRFNLWHVKDMNDSGNFSEVGNGTINYQEIFAASKMSGMEYFFVEQDRSDDPMKSIETSFNYLSGIL